MAKGKKTPIGRKTDYAATGAGKTGEAEVDNAQANDAQKSEVHAATPDASTYPAGDAAAALPPSAPQPTPPQRMRDKVRPSPAGGHIVSDESDDGGPINIVLDGDAGPKPEDKKR